MIIILDGPEKAGKSTTIAAIQQELQNRGRSSIVRHWGKVEPDDRVYTPFLMDDATRGPDDAVIIWDRSWASEHVYGKLLGRDRRLSTNPWLGEWLHGRATRAKFILLTDPIKLIERRNETDLPVNPTDEYAAYHDYGKRYGWDVIRASADPKTDAILIVNASLFQESYVVPQPPLYVGPLYPNVVFVGEKRSEGSSFPGSWLPFSSRLTMKYGEIFGDEALLAGWTNVGDVSRHFLQYPRIVISCGQAATEWVDGINVYRHVALPHPAWLYRFNSEEITTKRQRVQKTLLSIRERYFPKGEK